MTTAPSPSASPAELALAPLIATARAELDACCDRSVVPVLPSARRDLAALVTHRLIAVAARVLVHEHQAREATGARAALDADELAWRERFARYPALEPLLAEAARDACAHVAALLARLGADRADLAAELFGGQALGALAGIRGDAGDVHDGGQAVVLLRFDDGRRLVYKPKDLRVVRGVLALCAFLGAGLPLALHVRGLLVRRDHAWEEHVEPAPCRSVAEVRRFYARAGMLVALFELLEARDLWLDNLIAAGEHPAFIDLEMVLQPRRRARTTALAAERAAEDQLRDSIVNLGVLAMPTLIAPGIAAEQLGALTPAGTYLSPFRSIPALETMTGAHRPSRDGHVLWSHAAHAPTLDGAPVPAADHLDAVLEGHRAMRQAIAARRDALLAPGGPLDQLAGLPVRVIQRNTWSCHRIAQASLAPRLLAEPGRREAWLAGLVDDASGDDDRAIARREIAALARLDVPYFVCHSDGHDLLEADGSIVVPGYFEGSALDRVRRRIDDAGKPLAQREDLIRSTLATAQTEPFACDAAPDPLGAPPAVPPDGTPARPLGNPPVEATGTPRRHDTDEGVVLSWTAEATAIGDLILAEAIRAGEELTWIGLTLEPFHALRRVDVLGPDLLTGTAGIAIVLADLWAVTGHERFRDGALGALATTRRSRRDEPLAGAPPAIGAFYGAGARLYALQRCAVALGAPELAVAAAELAAATPIPAPATLDVVTGAAGLLLASLAAGADAAALVAWIDQRFDDPQARRSPYPPELRALDRLPDLAGGLALAGARLARQTGGAPRWTDGPRPIERSPSLPARLALAGELAADHGALRLEVGQALERTADPVEALDLAITAAHALADPGLGQRAAAIGRTIALRRRALGRWCPERLAADRHDLSAISGLAALAHGFLRLHARLPSIRLLESHAAAHER